MTPFKDRAARAESLLADQATYPQGCSEFVCKVLDISYRQAESLMGDDPEEISDWSKVAPGTIVGWKKNSGTPPFAHVAVFIAPGNFIDVKEPYPKNIPRRLSNYNRSVFYAHGVC